jgi:hypothetical protein
MTDGLTLDELLGRLARDELPWDKAWVADFGDFDARFTLHDSVWVGVFLALGGGNEAVLVIEWDAHWLPEPLHSECKHEPAGPPHFGRPFLLVRLSGVGAVRLSGYKEEMGGREIGHAAYRVDDGVGILEVVDIIGGTAILEFVGFAAFLAIGTRNGRLLDLATVELRSEPAVAEKPWWRFW